jgi:glycosyltransferase involved in cell wall biosynthesis
MVLPLVRLISRVKIVTNVDGIEWKRDKWNGIAKAFLRFSEYVAVKFSHTIISDNQAIANHVQNSYQTFSEVIAYGGDHAIAPSDVTIDHLKLPKEYALSLCRIEPENNVEMILSAFAKEHDHNLVFVGNWDGSEYGRSLKARYAIHKNITIVDPIYDLGVLYQIRNNSSLYFHGHSAGGTNPSLVEMMHFKKPIFCFDCDFNRYSTDDRAMYFSNSDDIVKGLQNKADNLHEVAESMQRLAHERYTWDIIGKRYFDLM